MRVRNFVLFMSVSLGFATSGSALAFFMDGKGQYSLRGVTQKHPAFDKQRGDFQAIEQSFRLSTEFRLTDRASLIMETRLFDDPRRAYLGDEARPTECSERTATSVARGGSDVPVYDPSNTGNAASCNGRHQNSSAPGYAPYYPKISEVYTQYALDWCLLKAGRRARSWGMGIFLDADYKPFDTQSSVFDGISCDINVQKSQTLAFSFGYDKLSETGVDTNETVRVVDNSKFGPGNQSDDLDQIFFTIQYDDRKANEGSKLTQQVGIYFANVIGREALKTDIKFADLYLNFFFSNWVVRNELLFRLGRSSDPSYTRLGGAGVTLKDTELVSANNKLDAIASAGSVEYFVSRSGSSSGPENFKKGNAQSHAIFLEYAYAPGDKDGYTKVYDTASDLGLRSDNRASAIAFHRNFKPAMILLNAQPQQDDLRIDGVFDPGRVMNVFLFGTGYRFKSIESGNFELKFITGRLNEGIPGAAKALYANAAERPIGYAGNDLGYELDLKYDMFLAQNLQVGAGGALAIPGEAWEIHRDQKPAPSFLLQSSLSFTF